jgi:hypothetical protein
MLSRLKKHLTHDDLLLVHAWFLYSLYCRVSRCYGTLSVDPGIGSKCETERLNASLPRCTEIPSALKKPALDFTALLRQYQQIKSTDYLDPHWQQAFATCCL